MQQKINFKIEADLWNKIYEQHTGHCGIRKRINNKFANDFLTKIIAKYNLKCVLSCKYNWLKADSSRKKDCTYWRGIFFCINCKTNYKTEIKNQPNLCDKNTFLEIEFDDILLCKELKKTRYNGEKREILANEIKLKGYSKLKSENIIYNSAFPDHERRLLNNFLNNFFYDQFNFCLEKITESNTLYQIKFELNHKERLTTDVIKDAEAAKHIMTYLIGGKTVQKDQYEIKLSDIEGAEEIITPVSNQVPNLGVNGYIHELMSNPFGYLLISEIQVILI